MKANPLKETRLASSVLGFDTSADGQKLFAACLDGGVYEIDESSGTTTELGRHGSYASGVRVLAGDTLVVSAGYDGVLAWRDRSGRTIREVKAHSFWSWQLASSPDERFVASVTGQYLAGGPRYEPRAESEPSVKILDVATGELVHAFSHEPPVQSVAFSNSGAFVAAGNLMGEVRIWSLETGELRARLKTDSFTGWGIIKGHYYTGGIFSLAFSPDDEHILLGGMGSTRDPAAGNGRQMWQRFAWRETEPRKVDETRPQDSGQGLMETLRFHPSGDELILAGRVQKGDWNVAFFNAASGERTDAFSSGHRVTNAVFSGDGKRLWLAGGASQGKPQKDGSFEPFGIIKSYELAL